LHPPLIGGYLVDDPTSTTNPTSRVERIFL
jgi:hypothetical protein